MIFYCKNNLYSFHRIVVFDLSDIVEHCYFSKYNKNDYTESIFNELERL